jgi:RNA polymerase sigma-70 factor (ECF subfamily)
MLKYFDKLLEHEIAEALNLPLGTVKSRIHRAKLMLKKKLVFPDGSEVQANE